MTPKPGERGPNRYPDDTYLRVAEENDARLQPDPELALSSGRASSTQIWMVTLAAIAITALLLYGLNQSPQNPQTASPPAATTTGAAPSSEQPPASEQKNRQEKAAPEQPAQEPGKQGPSDSAR